MMISRSRLAGVLAVLCGVAPIAQGTTCSCAGVPILGAMQLGSPNDRQWLFAGTYEYHDLSDLVSGSSSVNDQTGRDRTSQAFILEASTGLTQKWSFSALLSGVEHRRDIGGVVDEVSGIGDAIVMAKYAPRKISLYSRNALSFGIGARVPLGEDDAKSQGVTLAEDLQPSTGAAGAIGWIYAARALNESTSARIYGLLTHSYNGDNDRDYQFGHSTVASFGTSYQTGTPWGFNVELIYRHAERDRRASVDIPNTGGQWLDISPAIQYHINEKLALRASAKIPVAHDLNDELQFTTKYSLRLTLSWVFGD